MKVLWIGLKIAAIFLVIIIVLAITRVQYPDKIKYLRPVMENILEKSNTILKNRDSKFLSKMEIIKLLKESGCDEVLDVKSTVFKTGSGKDKLVEYDSHRFISECSINGGGIATVRFTARDWDFPNFRMDLSHSYCFDVLNERIDCFTQAIIPIPSGH